ncbi:hypothetical protein ACIQWN_06105 [Streptomyces vinaceus]|uniref:hypothetical protein n=1 Tax=Streptomyces vinaceus TaxID=1960 RepID=UPI0038178810
MTTEGSNHARWKKLEARLDAQAAARHAARVAEARKARESDDARLRAVIAEAVDKAVQGLLAGGAQFSESVQDTSEILEEEAAAPVTPLHAMEPGEWNRHASQYWASRMQATHEPLTMGEFLGRQPSDDGAA